MIGSHNLGVGSVPTAGDNPPGGIGTGDVDSVTATVPAVINNTDPANPVLNVSAVAPPAIGPASVGSSNDVARGNHTHATPSVADLAALALVDASTMNAGTFVQVVTLKSWFKLDAAGTSVASTGVRVAALNKAGFLWFRESIQPPWWNVTAWFVGPSASASVEANGTTALTPIPPQEFFRRTFLRWLPGTETGSVTVTVTANLGVNDYIQARWAPGFRAASQSLTIVGSQTAIVGSSGVISAATALNRATNTPNQITAGFSWAALVGKFIRLQGTTTTVAAVLKDQGANNARLSEQAVNLAVGTGFIAGQTVEAYNPVNVPGLHIDGPSNIVCSDVDFDPAAAAATIRCTGATRNAQFNRCRFRGTGATIQVFEAQMFGCIFADVTCNYGGNLNACNISSFVNMAGSGFQLLRGAAAENSFVSCVSQATTMTIGECTYAHVSGGGSASFGFFDLAALQKGFALFNASKLSCSGIWGSGNNASAVLVDIPTSAQWSVPSFALIGTVMSVTGGVGARLNTATAAIDVPLAQMPHALGPGQQPGAFDKFSGAIQTSAGGATIAYLADGGSEIAAAAANLGAQSYPTSERLVLRLRVNKLTGAGVTTNNVTATLYINGVATAMQVSVLAASAAGSKFVDSAHPLCLREGDDYDLRLDDAADVLAGTLRVSAALECAV